jgi:hypothetical protein
VQDVMHKEDPGFVGSLVKSVFEVSSFRRPLVPSGEADILKPGANYAVVMGKLS